MTESTTRWTAVGFDLDGTLARRESPWAGALLGAWRGAAVFGIRSILADGVYPNARGVCVLKAARQIEEA